MPQLTDRQKEIVFLANIAQPGVQGSREAQRLSERAAMTAVPCAGCGEIFSANELDGSTWLCGDCGFEAGLENAHADGRHDGEPHDDCPRCRDAEADLAILVAGGRVDTPLPAPVPIGLALFDVEPGQLVQIRLAS